MAEKKLFIVTPRVQESGKETPPRLMRATRRSQVESFLIGEVNIAPASADDAFKAAQAGVHIEELGE